MWVYSQSYTYHKFRRTFAFHQLALLQMISRRNIRIKVMQSIYALHNASISITPEQAGAILLKHFDQTAALFTSLLFYTTQVAQYAETDAKIKASKHLPTAADLVIPVKIAGNDLLWRILQSEFYKSATAKFKPALKVDNDWIKKLYNNLVDSTLYDIYNTSQSRDKKSEKEIIEFIFTDLLLANEDFTQFLEDQFTNWDDDAEMLRLLMFHFFQKPGVFKLNELVGKEKFDFGKSLLETVMERSAQLDEIIKPKLRNWDPERLAQLDTIILQMGTCEFLYFETIPVKVTINEYIDLAKEYSTQQSGMFVNGILDNIRKELESSNQIQKVDFKKQSV